MRLVLALLAAFLSTVAFAQPQLAKPPLYRESPADNDNSPRAATTAFVWSLIDLQGVRPEAYKLGSDPDDTLSIQRAANTGKTVLLASGKTYITCASIVGRRFLGLGTGATLKACPGFPYPDGSEPGNSFIRNPNWSAASITDTDLYVGNIAFDGTDIPAGGAHPSTGQFHSIKFRSARGILVENVRCTKVGNCTAFQATDQTVVRNSQATLVVNAGFDHWDGPTNAVAEGNLVTCDPSLGADAGIMFTAASTAYVNRSGNNLVSRNNRILGGACRTGLFVNNLSAGSSMSNIVSDGDYVDATGSSTTAAVIMEGNVQGARISGLTAIGGSSKNAIAIREDTVGSGSPTRVQINAPRIVNWSTDAGNYAPILLSGTYHSLTGANLTGGTNSTSVYTTSSTTSVSGTFAPASTVRPLRADGGPNAGEIAVPGMARTCSLEASQMRLCSSILTVANASAAATQLTLNGLGATSGNVPRLSETSYSTVSVDVSAFNTGTGASATYELRGYIFIRGVGPSQTYGPSSPPAFVLKTFNGSGGPDAWPLPTIAPDTTYGGVKVMSGAVNGVRYVARVTITEVQ